MKKMVRIILFVLAALLAAIFVFCSIYDYFALQSNPYASYRWQDSVFFSGILFLLPAIVCFSVSCFLRDSKNKSL